MSVRKAPVHPGPIFDISRETEILFYLLKVLLEMSSVCSGHRRKVFSRRATQKES